GVTLIEPDSEHQVRVMEAIYGPRSVKAGFTEGTCRDELMAAVRHLAARGATVAILGCTELPLILPQNEHFVLGVQEIAFLHPTLLLATACVRHARAARSPPSHE